MKTEKCESLLYVNYQSITHKRKSIEEPRTVSVPKGMCILNEKAGRRCQLRKWITH